MVTHLDTSVLPSSSQDVRDINLVLPSSESSSSRLHRGISNDQAEKTSDTPHFAPEQGYTMATHVMRDPRGREQVYQTTNPVMPINKELVLGIAKLERYVPPSPSFTLPPIQGENEQTD